MGFDYLVGSKTAVYLRGGSPLVYLAVHIISLSLRQCSQTDCETSGSRMPRQRLKATFVDQVTVAVAVVCCGVSRHMFARWRDHHLAAGWYVCVLAHGEGLMY